MKNRRGDLPPSKFWETFGESLEAYSLLAEVSSLRIQEFKEHSFGHLYSRCRDS
jgi:hypothetical protein